MSDIVRMNSWIVDQFLSHDFGDENGMENSSLRKLLNTMFTIIVLRPFEVFIKLAGMEIEI